MSSPLASHLFQRAILESGDCQSTFNRDIRTPIPYNSISGTGEEAGEQLAKALGVPGSPDILRNLRGIPADQILKTWSQNRQIHFDAIVDGWIVPEQPATIFAVGKQARVDVLTGSNADEATVFGRSVSTLEEYWAYLRRDMGAHADQEFKAYPATSDAEASRQYLQLQSDTFAFGARAMARAMRRAGQKAYLYFFTYAEKGKRANLGAYHGEELQLLSDSFPGDWEHTAEDARLGDAMRMYWTQFAKTGDPNAPGLPAWLAYNAHSDECLDLGRAIRAHHVAVRVLELQRIEEQVLAEKTFTAKTAASSPN